MSKAKNKTLTNSTKSHIINSARLSTSIGCIAPWEYLQIPEPASEEQLAIIASIANHLIYIASAHEELAKLYARLWEAE